MYFKSYFQIFKFAMKEQRVKSSYEKLTTYSIAKNNLIMGHSFEVSLSLGPPPLHSLYPQTSKFGLRKAHFWTSIIGILFMDILNMDILNWPGFILGLNRIWFPDAAIDD